MSSIVRLKRRELILGAAAALLTPPALAAEKARAGLVITPGQTEGPFYPVSFPADMDNDLVRVQGRAAGAMGQVTHIAGRVLDKRGEPVRGATVEIWQCDANGIYHHPPREACSGAMQTFKATGVPRPRRTAATASAPSAPSPIRAARRTSTSRCTRRAPAG